MHTQWRDCKEWKREGLPLSTTSDYSVKLFDAALTQYAGYYDEHEFGGMASTLSKIVEGLDYC